ncbi:hypothetical protein PG994_012534 [Apiospora phragmitis]|uniref:Uncharacterized protein n=1 Tax=Apiospora phragmitis TaxID=2905665 RepID=A0ABR1TVX2_9PEZI
MSELNNIWAELDLSKATESRNGRWGFTIYRTDWEDQKLWKNYKRHLRDVIGAKLDPERNIDPNAKTKDEKRIRAKRRRVRTAFESVVLEIRILEGRTTAEVRQYHRENKKKKKKKKKKKREAKSQRQARSRQNNLHNRNKLLNNYYYLHNRNNPNKYYPPHPNPHPPKTTHPARRRPYRPRLAGLLPPRQRRRPAKVQKGPGPRERPPPQPRDYAHNDTPVVAIVAEAERSDYRRRRFGAYRRDGSVPELGMDWQYVEVAGLPALYDRLSRRPLGLAQLWEEKEGKAAAASVYDNLGGGGEKRKKTVSDRGLLSARDHTRIKARGAAEAVHAYFGGGRGREIDGVRGLLFDRSYTTVETDDDGPLYDGTYATIETDDHGPWYEHFCFPPLVNSV